MCDFEVCSVQFWNWKLEVNTALTGHRTSSTCALTRIGMYVSRAEHGA